MSEHDVFEKAAPSAPIRNPYIMNFLKALVEKKGEQHQADDLKKLLGDMYRLFESLLGQNMVNALPEDVRKQYLEMAEDLPNLNYKNIGAVFNTNIKNYEQIMKDTMKQFAEIYFKNRQFSPEHYPVKLQSE
jgi:predicted alternative tryptophan synthase beta-subunit